MPSGTGRLPVTNEEKLVFRARGVTKIYQMGEVRVHALRGVDVDLFAGELTALLGPSGSGKSTLLNILGGLDTPTAGHVWYHGQDLTEAGERRLTDFRRNHVGFVFQFYNLIPSLTARENVAVVTEISTSPMDPAEALTIVGLAERMDHFPAQLSGGEQQRVAIARALVHEPTIVLADEPTGNLDLATAQQVVELLDDACRRHGTTLLMATHSTEVIGYADEVYELRDGHLERQ